VKRKKVKEHEESETYKEKWEKNENDGSKYVDEEKIRK
jgi:hypothetical protein